MTNFTSSKLKLFVISLLLIMTGSIEAEDTVNDLPVAELKLTPRLCIRGTSDEICKLNVLIEWDSNSSGKYCLHREGVEMPVKCWEQQSIGSINEQVAIIQNLDYWLVWFTSADELDRQVLTLLTAKPDDRRKTRRRRHAWSVF